MSGDDGGEVTPVPMPNTAVKFPSADGSWDFVSARVGRCQAIQCILFTYLLYTTNEMKSIFVILICITFHSSSVVEQSAVNRSVVGSNPTCGAWWRRSSAGESVRFIPERSRVRSPPPLLYFLIYGDRGEVVNAPDCGSGIRGFDPHRSPFISKTKDP